MQRDKINKFFKETLEQNKVSIVLPVFMTDQKTKITEKAHEQFMRYGIKSITMDDIARTLAISKKTLYQHFQDKDSLVYAVCEAHLESHNHEMCCIVSQASSAIDEMALLSEFIKNKITEMHPSVLHDIRKYHPRSWDLFVQHRESCIVNSIIFNLKRGVEEGVYRPDINVEILARLRLEQIQLSFDPEIFPPARYRFPDIQIQFFEHFLYGLLSNHGRVLWEQLRNKTLELQTLNQ